VPFIPKDERQNLNAGIKAITPGQICYLFYRHFVLEWKKEPRWTTAHNLHVNKKAHVRSVYFNYVDCEFNYEDAVTAWELAWKEFYDRYVRPYENQKLIDNGDVE